MPPTPESLLQHSQWIERLAMRLVKDSELADEVIQRAWLSALGSPPPDDRNLRAWWSRVIRNVAFRMSRDERVRKERERDAAREQQVSTVERATLHHEVVEAVLGLNEPYRTTILLRYFEDQSPAEIASGLGLPVQSIYTQLKRGRKMLRGSFQRDNDGDSHAWVAVLFPLFRSPPCPASLSGTAATKNPAATLIGVLLMSAKMKIALSMGILLAVALGIWATRGDDRPVSPSNGTGVEVGSSTAPDQPRTTVVDSDVPIEIASTLALPVEPKATACAITGRVLDENGSPVDGAVVVIAEAKQFGSPEYAFFFHQVPTATGARRVVTTEVSGRFEFPELAPGSNWALLATHPTSGIAYESGLELSAGSSPRVVEVQLAGGTVFHGTVTDQDREPVPGVYVHLFARGSQFAMTHTDSEGRFRFYPLRLAEVSLTVLDRRYYWDAGRRIEVTAGRREVETDIVLEAAPTLRGLIVNRDGQPAGLVRAIRDRLGISPTAALRASELYVCATEENIREGVNFRFSADRLADVLLVDDAYEVTVLRRHETYLSLWSGRTRLGGAEIVEPGIAPDIVVDMAVVQSLVPGSDVEFHAVDATSRETLERFEVEVMSLHDTKIPIANLETELRGSAQGGLYQTDGLSAGEYYATITSEGLVPTRVRFTVGARVPTATIEVALEKATARLVGVVRDADGEPFNGATLYLYRAGSTQAMPKTTAISNENGRFEFAGIPEGDFAIVAEAEGYAPDGTFADTSSTAEPELVLDLGVQVQLELTGSPTAAKEFSVRITGRDGILIYDDARQGSRRWGGADFRLAPGQWYDLEVFKAGHEVRSLHFHAQPDKSVAVEMIEIQN